MSETKDLILRMQEHATYAGHYGAWVGGVILQQGADHIGKQAKRIEELEKALRTIQREAHGIDQYLYDVASEVLEDE